jgi:hypothetical protein
VSHKHPVEDEGAQVADGSYDIRVETSAGECPKSVEFVP